MSGGSMSFKKAAVLNNVFEAQLLETILSDRQIPYDIKTYQDDVYGNLYTVTKGWGAVYAPADYKEEIEQFVRDLRNYADGEAEYEED